MKIIELRGGHYEMGRQHARQVRDLRPRIMRAISQRLRSLEEYEVDLQPYTVELTSAWGEIARPTLEMLRGIADELELEWDAFYRYTIAPYLEVRIQRPSYGEGCTVWAAAGPVTRQGTPMLAKNRDYRPEHRSLQRVVRATPVRGYRYLYVTSAGSPAVFSSGMNEAGLVVADTHVLSLDIGPGVARYSAMKEVLEHCSDVASALDYLRQVPHIGDGILVLIDQAGDMAVFEAGHSAHSIVRPEHNFLVSTNHFRGPRLCNCWVDGRPPELQGNSQNRYVKVVAALEATRGRVDTAWAKAFMADHGGPQPMVSQRRQYAICRHSDIDPLSTTISTALYLPQERTLRLADGQPCQVAFQAWSAM